MSSKASLADGSTILTIDLVAAKNEYIMIKLILFITQQITLWNYFGCLEMNCFSASPIDSGIKFFSFFANTLREM